MGRRKEDCPRGNGEEDGTVIQRREGGRGGMAYKGGEGGEVEGRTTNLTYLLLDMYV